MASSPSPSPSPWRSKRLNWCGAVPPWTPPCRHGRRAARHRVQRSNERWRRFGTVLRFTAAAPAGCRSLRRESARWTRRTRRPSHALELLLPAAASPLCEKRAHRVAVFRGHLEKRRGSPRSGPGVVQNADARPRWGRRCSLQTVILLAVSRSALKIGIGT